LPRNARTSPGVLLVFFCNGIDVIKKLHLCPFGWHREHQENTRRCSSIPHNCHYHHLKLFPMLSYWT
jgi:hypothetical protein